MHDNIMTKFILSIFLQFLIIIKLFKVYIILAFLFDLYEHKLIYLIVLTIDFILGTTFNFEHDAKLKQKLKQKCYHRPSFD